MLIYIPVPFTLAMSNIGSPMTQQLSPYQYQQHHHPTHHHQPTQQTQQVPPPQQSSPHQQPLTTVSLSRNSTSIMCAAPTQAPHHSHHHQHHHITVAHHQTSQMNGGGAYVGAATGFANGPPGGYTTVPRIHHCNAHSFLCSNPAFHQYQVSGGCIGHPPNYVTPFMAAGHATPILSHSASTQLLPAASHPQLYTQPAVSIGQPAVQQIGPSPQQPVTAPTHALPHPQMPHPHHHHHHHHHHHQHQQPTIVSPFPSHTHIHQLPPPPHQVPTSAGARSSGIEVLSRGLYRNASQGHVIGRVRRGGALPGMGGNRRGGNTWRGGNIQPVTPPTLPPPPPLPTTAAAAAAYPGILLHFLAMLSHPSLHQYNSVEPVVAPEAPDTENYEALLHLAERLGEAKPRGLIKTAIDQLPSYRYTGETCDTKQTTCVICMCEFELRQMLRVLPCLHEFHTKCVDKWLKSNRTCPICRGDASEYLTETPMAE